MWGLTAIYAYRAYKERSFLDDAIEIWQAYTPWVITVDDAASGSHPLKTTKFSSECNGSKCALLLSIVFNLKLVFIAVFRYRSRWCVFRESIATIWRFSNCVLICDLLKRIDDGNKGDVSIMGGSDGYVSGHTLCATHNL